uniref:(Protein-PII) uridylyltransferase (PII uridylyl-transferase) (Uridylyl-removing enzyme) (UTase) n=1 Tax=mine drainage metagenome TaxID=410659 RepID=E6QRA3_9ZZZZ
MAQQKLNPTEMWRDRFRASREQAWQTFVNGASVRSLLSHQTRLTDQLLQDIWQALQLPYTAALVAVGGYGRRELFPYSDIDLLILLSEAPSAIEQASIEQFITLLWDIGLEVGHSVRTVTDCLEESAADLTTQTNLLEARFLTGNRVLYQQFQQQFFAALAPRLFFEGKISELDQRHARFNDSEGQLEPNIKESPGGLRDLHTLRWLSQVVGIGNQWRDLVTAGLLNAAEARQMQRLERILFDMRVRLHATAGRSEDRLLFAYQGQLAQQYAISASTQRRASELLMQRYYRVSKMVAQMCDILLPSLRARAFGNPELTAVAINARFQIRDNLLKLVDEHLFEREPRAIFESFLLLQQHSELSGMSASTLRALWRARHVINKHFRQDPVNHKQFLQLLRAPQGVTSALRDLNRYGILGRYIPAFGRIVGQMQHDLFHIYTVDAHILTVLRNLRRLTVPELAHEYPLASRLISGFPQVEVLYLAALFHDIAKGRGGDHSQLGRSDARRFCRLHQLDAADTELVVWLVQEHLKFSSVAQKQDLSDPDVIARFVAHIPDQRHLIALYLLTVCDIRGTSPTVWNAWKGKLLEDLFYASKQCLTGDMPPLDGVDQKKALATQLLGLYDLVPDMGNDLWKQLDNSYFMRHSPAEIAWHCRQLWQNVHTPTPIVRAHLSPDGAGIQVMIYTPDESSLFARICAFFDQIRFTIVDAKIQTTRHGYALDSFIVLDPQGHGSSYRDFLQHIESELTQQLLTDAPIKAHAQGRISRQLKHFPIDAEIQLRADEKGRFYSLNLVAGDRPGLLFSIAQMLYRHHIHLHLAKIGTLGERAEDNFLIWGDTLNQVQARTKFETDLLEILNA